MNRQGRIAAGAGGQELATGAVGATGEGSASARRIVAGPFNRVEGDVEVVLEIADGRVRQARVHAPLFRGFELMLHGRDPRDALAYVPRICGICSVSQSMAAAAALADAMNLRPAANGRIAANLVLACENVADHITHFYLFFMPDFASKQYAGRGWHEEVCARFVAQSGAAAQEVLPARAQWMHITGLLAGKWPHTLAIQPGGTTRPVSAAEKMRLRQIIKRFRQFLEQVLFAAPLEEVAALQDVQALEHFVQRHADGDFARFVQLADDLALHEVGRGPARFMSFGAHEAPGEAHGDGAHLFARGVFANGVVQPLDEQAIAEDASHAWLGADRAATHPFDGATLPEADKAGAYTWSKAPRLNGEVVEVGALARQVVDGQPLACALLDDAGRGSVLARVVARLLEVARIVPAMERWVAALAPDGGFCTHGEMPQEARGAGLVEAARGSLGHWLVVRNGRILNYQIVAPTTWNFSPRDAAGRPGALEQALEGLAVDDAAADDVRIQHVVRSFDPCMVCTVH